MSGAVGRLSPAQLVPYGRGHTDPTPTQSPEFDSARTEQLFTGACADRRSDQTMAVAQHRGAVRGGRWG